MTESELRGLARRYFEALERGVIGADLAEFFTEDVIQEEFPNALVPTGAKRDLAALLKGAERGSKLLRSQRYEVLNLVIAGQTVIAEVAWTGTLDVSLKTLGAGERMRARFAVFLDCRDGRIARQRNYDCFEPLGG